jgi:surfactin synthase thioesterase subunit
LTVRVAALPFLFLGVAFGASVPFVLAYLERNGELPMTFWFRSTAGPFEQLEPVVEP